MASKKAPYLAAAADNGVRPLKTKLMMRVLKWLALLPLLTGLAACEDFRLLSQTEPGQLRWILDPGTLTKADSELPDTNDFILTIRNSQGKTLYEGSYGASPEVLDVNPGSYTVSIESIPFTSPAFSRPQYGDSQVVVVKAGEIVTVRLVCSLLNAGIRLHIASDFLTSYPDGVLYVKQDNVRLKYLYREERIAYFLPGPVSLILYNQGKDETLFTRSLSAREILSVKVSAPAASSQSGPSIQVAVDTSKTWNQFAYVIGGGSGGTNGGEAPETALSVGSVPDHLGETPLWVYGYIVGGDLTSNGASVKTSGFTKATHLALADRASVTAKSSCLAVELPQGRVRDALNLVDHPDLVGTRVYLKGKLVDRYFGTYGMKGTSDFSLK